MSAAPFHLTARDGPLILSAPHPGRAMPPDIAARLTPIALAQPDADHQIDGLYDFADELGATVLTAAWSRYVVDLNRPPDNAPLYPGQFGSGLAPTETFEGEPLYIDGAGLDAAEVDLRVQSYWRPYHQALADEIARVKARHGYCLLWDCHSIAPVAPLLFEGRLPDINLGSFSGGACPAVVAQAVIEAVPADAPYSRVLDGRFKGGYITRHYGAPAQGVFALQLELAQSAYLGPDHRTIDKDLHARFRPILRAMIDTFLNEAPRHV